MLSNQSYLSREMDFFSWDYLGTLKLLYCSNGHLNELLNEEIEKIKDFVKNRRMSRLPGNATIEEDLYDAQVCHTSSADIKLNILCIWK